jgi:hypothetical protein
VERVGSIFRVELSHYFFYLENISDTFFRNAALIIIPHGATSLRKAFFILDWPTIRMKGGHCYLIRAYHGHADWGVSSNTRVVGRVLVE